MPWTRDPDLSLRSNIVQHIKSRLLDAETSPGEPAFAALIQSPGVKLSTLLTPSAAVYDLRETKTREIGYHLCQLNIAIEFYAANPLDEDPSVTLNRLLLLIQREMRSDIYCGGLTLNLQETRNEFDVDGPEDRMVAGVTFWTATYRHKENDPAKLVGEI